MYLCPTIPHSRINFDFGISRDSRYGYEQYYGYQQHMTPRLFFGHSTPVPARFTEPTTTPFPALISPTKRPISGSQALKLVNPPDLTEIDGYGSPVAPVLG